MRAKWEAHLQHINISHALQKDGSQLVLLVRNSEEEITDCIGKLATPEEKIALKFGENGRRINPTRNCVTRRERVNFQRWPEMSRGEGVVLYRECTTANKWIYNRAGLFSFEWTNCLMIRINGAALRVHKGRSKDSPGCTAPACSKRETFAHVLGKCLKSELLVNARHHRIRSMVAEDSG